jgi:Flp pilus assembly protein CpaB
VLAGCLGFAAIMTVNLVALTQMTWHVSRAGNAAQEAETTGLVAASGLKPGEHIAIASDVSWELWEPLAFEVPWTSLQFFSTGGAPPADAAVVEVPWPTGQGAQAIRPKAPAGWRIVAENQTEGWIVWRRA